MVSNRLFDRTILTVKHYSFEDCPRCAALPVVTYDGDVFECGCGGSKCCKVRCGCLSAARTDWNEWAAKERKRLLNQIKNAPKKRGNNANN